MKSVEILILFLHCQYSYMLFCYTQMDIGIISIPRCKINIIIDYAAISLGIYMKPNYSDRTATLLRVRCNLYMKPN